MPGDGRMYGRMYVCNGRAHKKKVDKVYYHFLKSEWNQQWDHETSKTNGESNK